MIVRALDLNGDFTFGRGKNNYLSNLDAVQQLIKTRLLSFLGDCFFDSSAGIDWFNLLGSKDQLALKLRISAVILNTQNVTGLVELSVNLDKNRRISISYSASTLFTGITNQDGLITGKTGYFLDESGNVLTTESGNPIGA